MLWSDDSCGRRMPVFVMRATAADWMYGNRTLSASCFFFLHLNYLFYFLLFPLYFLSDAFCYWEGSSYSKTYSTSTICCRLSFMPTCFLHMTHSYHRGKKTWAKTVRKTLENQDTIWHLWSLNDFLLGVGLCPTGKSQKTGGENYIRENVYAAHLAPSLFCPCKRAIIRLLLTSQGGIWEFLSISSLWAAAGIAYPFFLCQLELPI